MVSPYKPSVGVYPIYAICAGGLGWSMYYLARLARGPEVVWSRNNPEPWKSIKPNETVKMMNPNGRFAGSWKRDAI
ncbi:hypothetical protein HK102_005240 [Quaeritorhiza haematococci]|nr:hypothetical protein HK102_005240 [Quaeritorhiza haematococci]